MSLLIFFQKTLIFFKQVPILRRRHFIAKEHWLHFVLLFNPGLQVSTSVADC